MMLSYIPFNPIRRVTSYVTSTQMRHVNQEARSGKAEYT